MNSRANRVSTSPSDTRQVTLLELLDRLLDKGVVLRGDITLSVANVDLIVLDLAVMLASAERASHLLMPLAVNEELPGPAR